MLLAITPAFIVSGNICNAYFAKQITTRKLPHAEKAPLQATRIGREKNAYTYIGAPSQ
jgi:hypothetical protein